MNLSILIFVFWTNIIFHLSLQFVKANGLTVLGKLKYNILKNALIFENIFHLYWFLLVYYFITH